MRLSGSQKRALQIMIQYQCFAVRSTHTARPRCYYLPAKHGDVIQYAMWRTSLRNDTLDSLLRRQLVSKADVGDRASRHIIFYALTAKGRELAKEVK